MKYPSYLLAFALCTTTIISFPAFGMEDEADRTLKRIQGNSRLVADFISAKQNNGRLSDNELITQVVKKSVGQQRWNALGNIRQQSVFETILLKVQNQSCNASLQPQTTTMNSFPVVSMENSEDVIRSAITQHISAITNRASETLDSGDGNEYCISMLVIPACIDEAIPGAWNKLGRYQDSIYQAILKEIEDNDQKAAFIQKELTAIANSSISDEFDYDITVPYTVNEIVGQGVWESLILHKQHSLFKEIVAEASAIETAALLAPLGEQLTEYYNNNRHAASLAEIVPSFLAKRIRYNPEKWFSLKPAGKDYILEYAQQLISAYSSESKNATAYQHVAVVQPTIMTTTTTVLPTATVAPLPSGFYDKLSIIIEVNPATAKDIRMATRIEELKSLIPAGVRLSITPDAGQHISLECFNYDHPQDPSMHQYFGDPAVHYLQRTMARFAGSSQRQKGIYNGVGFDLQLWCHIKAPNQHFHFSMKESNKDKVYSINSLPQILNKAGGQIDNAHLVLRVGTQGKFRNDWNKLVGGDNGFMAKQDGEAKAAGKSTMKPYLLEYDNLKTHITRAGLTKPVINVDGSTTLIPFSGSADWAFLQKIYKTAAGNYKQQVPINIDTLCISTRVGGKLTYVGKPVSLKK